MEFLGHLCRSAEAEALPFLVVGGYAVAAHGHERATFDLDILVPREATARWKQWLERRGYRLFHETTAFAQYVAVEPGLPPLDLMTVDASTFAKLQAAHIEKRVAGVNLPLPRVDHLIAMKLQAARSRPEHRGGQDWNDVLQLIAVSGLDVRAADFKAIVQRYGDPTAYERILEHFPTS